MITQTATPHPTRLTDQPTGWHLFYLLPQTHYVRRQRAANSPQYHPWKKPVTADYGATSRKQTYYQRVTGTITAARNRAWISLKQAGRWFTRLLMKWFLLPVGIAACFSMVDASPAELPVDYYGSEGTVQMEQM